jgi:hypothetical protein
MATGTAALEVGLPPRLFQPVPDVAAIYTRLIHFPISVRKELLTAVRVQQPPSSNARLRASMPIWSSSYFLDPSIQYYPKPYRALEPALSTILTSPVLSAFLSMALRAEPFPDDDEAAEVIRAGIMKEIGAAIENVPPTINWSPLFDPPTLDDIHASFIPNGPIRPHLYLYLRYRLSRWKEKIAETLLVPEMSHKTMGLISSTHLHAAQPHCIRRMKPRLYTTCEAEEFYAEEGYLPDGPCEMRYAWKYNDLKPRVYYAQGLSAYKASRYVHDIFDSLQRVCSV